MSVCDVVAVCVLMVSATLSAQAENRLFIVANNPDGYGVDRCLAAGAPCGKAIAAAYCQAREFNAAVSYRKAERDDITGIVPVSTNQCSGGSCEAFVAIECSR
jgi:hypothetical protein